MTDVFPLQQPIERKSRGLTSVARKRLLKLPLAAMRSTARPARQYVQYRYGICSIYIAGSCYVGSSKRWPASPAHQRYTAGKFENVTRSVKLEGAVGDVQLGANFFVFKTRKQCAYVPSEFLCSYLLENSLLFVQEKKCV